jgi:ubiquitin C-terminal hydrolase
METIKIEGSPEYLRIKLTIVNADGSRNNNPMAIPDVLDLSQYQAVAGIPPSLFYRLSSVLAHGGTSRGGHWVGSVRGPNQVFYINDDTVDDRHVLQLKANPQVHGGREMQAVVLMYRRFEKRL